VSCVRIYYASFIKALNLSALTSSPELRGFTLLKKHAKILVPNTRTASKAFGKAAMLK
jgi:hypothetical protein